MCLKTRNERKIAEEDIVVYKILRKITDLDKNEVFYEPPYQWGDFKYKQGINSVGNELEQVNRRYNFLDGDHICVEGGFLHAFMEKPYAIAHRNWNFENLSPPNFHYTLEYNVYKMVIPKGTEYFVGSYHDICAKELLWEDMTPCEESKMSKEYVSECLQKS